MNDYQAFNIEQFRSELNQSVGNTNDMLAEEGTYQAYGIFGSNDQCFIQFIDLSNGTLIQTYQVDLNKLYRPYNQEYSLDGGDEEYEGLENWMVNLDIIKKIGVKINMT